MIEKNQFYKKIVNNSKLLFTIFIILIIVLFVIIPFPKFNGSISGFNLENNQDFINYNRTDSIFKNGSKIYFGKIKLGQKINMVFFFLILV